MKNWQGLFKRGLDYVVVRRIKLTEKDVLQPGTIIKWSERTLKIYHLRSLFRRRMIGIEGSSWANSFLQNPKFNPVLRKENRIKKKIKKGEGGNV